MFSGCDIRSVLSPGSITCSTALVAAGPEEPRNYEDLLDNARRRNCKILKPFVQQDAGLLHCSSISTASTSVTTIPSQNDKPFINIILLLAHTLQGHRKAWPITSEDSQSAPRLSGPPSSLCCSSTRCSYRQNTVLSAILRPVVGSADMSIHRINSIFQAWIRLPMVMHAGPAGSIKQIPSFEPFCQ